MSPALRPPLLRLVRRNKTKRKQTQAAAMATTAADGPPVEPQSLKKLSLRSLKRSLDLFAPAHALLFTPDAER